MEKELEEKAQWTSVGITIASLGDHFKRRRKDNVVIRRNVLVRTLSKNKFRRRQLQIAFAI